MCAWNGGLGSLKWSNIGICNFKLLLEYGMTRFKNILQQLVNIIFRWFVVLDLGLGGLLQNSHSQPQMNISWTTCVSLLSQGFSGLGEKTTIWHNYKLKKKRCCTTRILKVFSMRVFNAWNRLTVHVVNAASINAFKSRLDMSWAHTMFSPELTPHEQLWWLISQKLRQHVKTCQQDYVLWRQKRICICICRICMYGN